QNGMYDPLEGDHPCIAGDFALYMIFNDKGGPHAETGGDPFGIEVHMMPFAYSGGGDQDLWNTVFVHYRLINRSMVTYTNFRAGSFADADIGCSNDDIMGTDVQRNMIYAYNGDQLDEDCLGSTGFAELPPAMGTVVLKGMLLDPDGIDNPIANELPEYNGSGFGDG